MISVIILFQCLGRPLHSLLSEADRSQLKAFTNVAVLLQMMHCHSYHILWVSMQDSLRVNALVLVSELPSRLCAG